MCVLGVRGGGVLRLQFILVFGLPSTLLTGSGYSLVRFLVYKFLLSSFARVLLNHPRAQI